MAEMTYTQAYQQAVSTNYLYNRNRDRWQFLLDSYNGGDDYRNGAYLQRYQLETDAEYENRLKNVPLDNQVRSIVSLYNSFLFRTGPSRSLGQLEYTAIAQAILEDADLDGRSMDAFMKDVSAWANVFGHVWVCVAKPNTQASTLAAEIALGVRPYLSLYTPLAVTDWRWAQQPNGGYALSYIKLVEEVNDTLVKYVEWTEEWIVTTVVDTNAKTATDYYAVPNELGRLPFVCVYSERSPVRGLGISAITDIADQQRMIYNELAEVYDSIRLDTHPSLVATSETDVSGAAAGQVITMPENMDPALKPYVLQFQGGQIGQIYESIMNRRKIIDGMANVGSVRASETREMSGIAIETEFQLLNARLSSIADNLELAEEQIWQEVCNYLGIVWNGSIDYPDSFALRNVENELTQLQTAKNITTNPVILAAIDNKLVELLDIELEDVTTQMIEPGQEEIEVETQLLIEAETMAHEQMEKDIKQQLYGPLPDEGEETVVVRPIAQA